jgi:hypothetical protein
MSESPEAAARRNYIVQKRLDYLFRAAWHSIAAERGYLVDMALGTSSHGTIAIRSYLAVNYL